MNRVLFFTVSICLFFKCLSYWYYLRFSHLLLFHQSPKDSISKVEIFASLSFIPAEKGGKKTKSWISHHCFLYWSFALFNLITLAWIWWPCFLFFFFPFGKKTRLPSSIHYILNKWHLISYASSMWPASELFYQYSNRKCMYIYIYIHL